LKFLLAPVIHYEGMHVATALDHAEDIPASYAFAALMLTNGAAHLIFTIHRHAWVSGPITSPLLLIASLNLWLAARA